MGAGAAVVSGEKAGYAHLLNPQPHLVQQQETYHLNAWIVLLYVPKIHLIRHLFDEIIPRSLITLQRMATMVV